MIKNKRLSVLQVAEILRKYDKHRLNRKVFNQFTEKDFKSVQYIIDNGEPDPSDLVNRNIEKIYVLQDKKGNPLEFESVAEMSEHFGFKAKNYWKKYIADAGYELVRIEEC
jgi:hypothetical protein